MSGWFSAVSAVIPILWLLISLGILKMASYKACSIGLLASVLIAVAVWRMDAAMALKAALEGGLFALVPIIWVIVAAFFTYNVSVKTGAVDHIRALLSGVSGDRRVQALLIAWGFGGFMEAVAGFGTAVAVPAALLIALGFDPFAAALVCLLANTVPVAFGVLGIPLTTLARITDLPVVSLSGGVVSQLTPFVILVPFVLVLTVTKSLKGLKGVWVPTLASGAAYGAAQYVTALYVGPELPAVAGSVVSAAVTVLCVKLLPPPSEWKFPGELEPAASAEPGEKKGAADVPSNRVDLREQLSAWSPYLLLLVLVIGSSRLFPAVNGLLSKANLSFLAYDGPGGKPLRFDLLLTPGTIVFISAVAGGLIRKASPKRLAEILGDTVFQLRKTIVTVVCIVAMAKVLAYSGMVGALAASAAAVTGSLFPLFAPSIGALGTFLTGSDTSSNILFGLLQKQTALRLGLDPVWISAANTSGACIGKLISPQSIAIAATAAGLAGREGDLLLKTFKYAAAFLAALGLLVYAFAV